MERATERIGRRIARLPETGSVIVIILFFMAIFSCMAAALVSGTDLAFQASQNQVRSANAHAMAESGLFFARQLLEELPVPKNASPAEILQSAVESINDAYGGTAVFNGASAAAEGNAVVMPAVSMNTITPASGFTLSISYEGQDGEGNNLFRLTSKGISGQGRRTISVLLVVREHKGVLDHAVASKGIIAMVGNATITGKNNPEEANVLSCSMSYHTPIYVGRNAYVSGGAEIVNPDGSIVYASSINGPKRVGVKEPPFPTFDTTSFKSYCTQTVGSKKVKNEVIDNARIPPNSDTTFTDCTFRGILYIESPNRIKFAGDANIMGIIVAEEPSSPNLWGNQIIFSGHSQMTGVEALPADPEFDAVRTLTGTQILAPGFAITSTGSSHINADSGCIVASSFTFGGTFQGAVHGSIINLDDNPFVQIGTTDLVFDRSDMDQSPAGLIFTDCIFYVAGSYQE